MTTTTNLDSLSKRVQDIISGKTTQSDNYTDKPNNLHPRAFSEADHLKKLEAITAPQELDESDLLKMANAIGRGLDEFMNYDGTISSTEFNSLRAEYSKVKS